MAKRGGGSSGRVGGGGPLGAGHRVVVLHGDDTFLMGERVSELRAALEAAHGADGVDVVRLDGGATGLAEVLDECRTVGLMQQHKLVVVDKGELLAREDGRAALERYAASPSVSATLVLRCERWYAGKLDEIIAAHGGVVEAVSAGKPSDPAAWATQRAERHGARLTAEAARLLVQRLGDDLGRIDSELEKLATFAGSGGSGSGGGGQGGAVISAAMVAELVGLTREEEVWGMQQVLLTGNVPAALGHLRVILENSRKDAAVPLSWAFMDLARKLHGASRGLRSGENPWQLAGKLKLWGPAKEAVISAAGRVEPGRLAGLLRAAVEADFRAKSGLGDFEGQLERLTVRFARALGR